MVKHVVHGHGPLSIHCLWTSFWVLLSALMSLAAICWVREEGPSSDTVYATVICGEGCKLVFMQHLMAVSDIVTLYVQIGNEMQTAKLQCWEDPV
jgi:hypothetical protein